LGKNGVHCFRGRKKKEVSEKRGSSFLARKGEKGKLLFIGGEGETWKDLERPSRLKRKLREKVSVLCKGVSYL